MRFSFVAAVGVVFVVVVVEVVVVVTMIVTVVVVAATAAAAAAVVLLAFVCVGGAWLLSFDRSLTRNYDTLCSLLFCNDNIYCRCSCFAVLRFF